MNPKTNLKELPDARPGSVIARRNRERVLGGKHYKASGDGFCELGQSGIL